MKLVLLVAFGVLVALASGKTPQILKEFSLGNIQFSADLYKEILKSNPSNFLVCPISVELVLALIQTGAKGKTAQELSAALHLPENPKQIFSELTSTLKSNEYYNLSSANKIYVKDEFKISDTFKTTALNVFDAEIQTINFSKSQEASSEINQWVENKTHHKIKNLITPNDLDGSTIAVLINAMFFQGHWIKEFDEQTQKKPFKLTSKNQIQTNMMKVTDIFNYYESHELDAKYLELWYKGYEVSMTIVLPNNMEGLAALETRLQDVISNTFPKYEFEVNVEIPKFKIETTIPFNPILETLGIKEAFGDSADFSGIAANQGNFKISKVVQKTFIEVDEKGTTAAAALFLNIVATSGFESSEPPKEFIADHPFIFYLKHRSTVLFVGRFVSPNN